MRKAKQCIMGLFVAMVSVFLLTIPVNAETVSGDYEYEEYNDGTVTITKYCGTDTEVVIPEKLDGKPVTRIEDRAFSGCTSLESVTIPDSVTELGEYAFSYCTSLKSVTIPDSVTELGERAFLDCESLKEITFPRLLTTIESEMCSGCTELVSVKLPEKLDTIHAYAFYDTEITQVSINNAECVISTTAFGRKYADSKNIINHSFTVTGIPGSGAEKFARDNGMQFVSCDGTYSRDYANVKGCYEAALKNCEASLDFLTEYYIQKFPEMSLEPMYGLPEDRAFFTQLAKQIIEEQPDVTPIEALYNWMNDNNTSVEGYEYGYPMDVYNYKAADCCGNAMLLCELIRSAGIPAVIAEGWGGDMTDIITERKLMNGEETNHAWVFVYYDGSWLLADSAMDMLIGDVQEMAKWYYTLSVDEGIMVYNDYMNTNLKDSSAYFKDGNVFGYWDYSLDLEVGSHTEEIFPENVLWHFEELSQETYRGTDEKVSFGKEGWLSNGKYVKKNGLLKNRDFLVEGDTIYYFGQNGWPYDITDLKGRFETIYNSPLITTGTRFKVISVIEDGDWNQVDEGLELDTAGYFTAVYKWDMNEPAWQQAWDSTGVLDVWIQPVYAELEELLMDASELELEVEEIRRLSVIFKPNNIKPNTAVSWSCDNPNVVALIPDNTSVSVIAVGEGTATITATCNGKTAGCKITVGKPENPGGEDDIPISGIEINALPAKTVYEPGETFDATGLIVFGHTDSGYKMAIDISQCTLAGFDASKFGSSTITVNYKGMTATFDVVVAHTLLDNEISVGMKYYYTGQAICPQPVVSYNGNTLVKGKDYTVSYGDNTNAGTGSVTVTGMGNYRGIISKEITIEAHPVLADEVKITLEEPDDGYSTPSDYICNNTKLTIGEKQLEYQKDYYISNIEYSTKKGCLANVNVTIVFMENYSGTGTWNISLPAIVLNQSEVSLLVGETYQLRVGYENYEGTPEGVIYTSDNGSVAAVDQNGRISAVGAGRAVITATKGSRTASCVVTVEKAAEDIETPPDDNENDATDKPYGDYTGLVLDGSWWCVENGEVIKDYTGLWYDQNVGWWYVENGAINFGYNGLIPYAGCWWCVAGGQVIFDYTGLWNDPYVGWWYVENGTINFGYNGLIPYADCWWCVAGGRVAFEYTGCWTDPYVGTWYVENGIINFAYGQVAQ